MIPGRLLIFVMVLTWSGPGWAAQQNDHGPAAPEAAQPASPLVGSAAKKPAGRAAPDNAAAPIGVRTDLSRTALWVGDPFTYTIEISCPPGTDILADDISRDRLRVTGLEILDVTQQRLSLPDGTTVYRAVFRLASYVSDGTPVKIDALPVRYYIHTAGERVESLVPSDEVELPEVPIAVRSTLPDEEPSGIRDARTISTLPPAVRFLTPVGVAFVALSLAPVVFGLVAAAARLRRPKRKDRSWWRSRRERRQALEGIRALDVTSDSDARREAFDKIDALVRDCLTDLDIPARALTADEIEKRIAKRSKRLAAGELAGVLRDCEKARYGGPDHLPASEVVTSALEKTEQLVSARIR